MTQKGTIDNGDKSAAFDLILDEMSPNEAKALGVYGRMRRGYSKQDALKYYGISEDEYDAVIDKALM